MRRAMNYNGVYGRLGVGEPVCVVQCARVIAVSACATMWSDFEPKLAGIHAELHAETEKYDK